jgi:hypothetical protein
MNPELAASSETLDAASATGRQNGTIEHRLLLLLQPIVDLLAHRVFAESMVLLNHAFKLFALAGNFVEILIREMTPLLLDLAFELLPVSFDAIPIHSKLLSFQRCDNIGPLHRSPLTVVERNWFQRRLGETAELAFNLTLRPP